MQAAMKTKKPRKQAVSGCFWAKRTYRGRIKDDHKIDPAAGSGNFLTESYMALRKLENEALELIYNGAQTLLNPVKVSISQFYGIVNSFIIYFIVCFCIFDGKRGQNPETNGKKQE